MLRTDDMIKSQLLLKSWQYTADIGGYLATVMVMGAIMGRIKAGWGGHLEVLERLPLFAAENNWPNSNKMPQIWEPSFVRLLHEVEGQFDNSMPDLSKGALYFCDLRYVERDWFKNKILANPESHPRVAEMNSLAFFK